MTKRQRPPTLPRLTKTLRVQARGAKHNPAKKVAGKVNLTDWRLASIDRLEELMRKPFAKIEDILEKALATTADALEPTVMAAAREAIELALTESDIEFALLADRPAIPSSESPLTVYVNIDVGSSEGCPVVYSFDLNKAINVDADPKKLSTLAEALHELADSVNASALAVRE